MSVVAILALVAGLLWYFDSFGASSVDDSSANRRTAGQGNEPRRAPNETREFRRSLPAPVADDATDRRSVFRGRFVDGAGQPVHGVATRLSAWAADDEAVAAHVGKHGAIDWSDPKYQRSGADGRFEYRVAVPAPYAVGLHVSARGYRRQRARWSGVEAGAVIDLGDVLMLEGCVVHGRVLDDAGLPRGSVQVRLYEAERTRHPEGELMPNSPSSVRTAEDGTFRFRGLLGVGKWLVWLRGERIVGPESVTIMPRDRDRQVEIIVVSKASIPSIHGLVVDAGGQPVRDAEIWAKGGPGFRDCRTGKDGAFVFERSPKERRGEVPVFVYCEGYETSVTKQPVRWGSKDVRLVLRRGVDMAVVVTDAATKQPVEEFSLRLVVSWYQWYYVGGNDQGLKGRGPNTDGRMALPGMRRGVYRFRIEPRDPRFVSSEYRDVTVADGNPTEIRFELKAPIRGRVRVVDGAGKPVVGTKVELLEALGSKPVTISTRSSPRVDEHIEEDTDLARLWSSGTTGKRGECFVSGPPSRSLAVRVIGQDHVPTVAGIVLNGSEDVVVVQVQKGATVFGRVKPLELLAQMRELSTGGGAMPPEPAGLDLQRRKFGAEYLTLPRNGTYAIGKDGAYEITGVPPGDWNLRIRWSRATGKNSRQSAPIPIHALPGLRDGERREVDLNLDHLRFGKVRGRVELDGAPFAGRVSLRSARTSAHATANARGEFESTLIPGEYRVVIQPVIDGHYTVLVGEPGLTVTPGQTVDQVVRVQKVDYRLKILGSDGRPRPGLTLRAKVGRQIRFLNVSDAAGISQTWLSAGAYELVVWPKALSSDAARRKFDEENRGDPTAADRIFVPLGTVTVAPKSGVHTVRLPLSSGY